MRGATVLVLLLSQGAIASACAQPRTPRVDTLVVGSTSGLQLRVATESSDPLLRVVLPGHDTADRSIEVLFPEHVTALRHGQAAEQLYVFRRGNRGRRPSWRKAGGALEYERDLPGAVHLLARATLEDDGVRFRYEFQNQSTAAAYDMIYAVTDPRLTSEFHDERLERTYVHHPDGFDLLASETPARLSESRDRWLPARYLASYTWPVPARLVERRDDGVTYYTKSRAVDEPFIATLSKDSAWVVASFTRETGNVWSNPELTCQHVDPQASLSPNGHAVVEVKILILRGSLDDALQRSRQQRSMLGG